MAQGRDRGLALLELIDPLGERAAATWQSLATRSPPSYFLSWGWIENWLATLPGDRVPQLAVFDDASACFLARRLVWHHGVVPSRTLYVNATGAERLDELWIEYNALVGRDLALEAFLDALPGWDEVVLPGALASAFGGLASRHRVLRREVPAYVVELDRVRERGYLSLLSGGTRSQVRRAQREAGPIDVTIARDAAEAIDIYAELVALHSQQWRGKGKPGAFADPWFDRFHRRLVAQRSPHGEIQLVRVTNAAGTIGCLYNFVWRGRVLAYQSGFRTYADPHMKPGYVCHTAAIDHAARAGLEVYDFLGGEMRYKRSLSTTSTRLVWATVQRARLRFAIENRLLAAWRARRSAASTTPPSADARR